MTLINPSDEMTDLLQLLLGPMQQVYVCHWDNCGAHFTTCELLGKHFAESHLADAKEPFECRWTGCTRANIPFQKAQRLAMHIRVHTGERPFKCHHSGCAKGFPRADSLAAHIRQIHKKPAPKTLTTVPLKLCSVPSIAPIRLSGCKRRAITDVEEQLPKRPLSLSSEYYFDLLMDCHLFIQ